MKLILVSFSKASVVSNVRALPHLIFFFFFCLTPGSFPFHLPNHCSFFWCLCVSPDRLGYDALWEKTKSEWFSITHYFSFTQVYYRWRWLSLAVMSFIWCVLSCNMWFCDRKNMEEESMKNHATLFKYFFLEVQFAYMYRKENARRHW